MQERYQKSLPTKRIFLICVGLIILLAISSSYVMAQDNVIKVQTESLNVRLGPGLSYTVMDQASQGQSFNILDENNEWYKIRLNDDRIGWVAKWEIDQAQPAAYDHIIARVTADFANIRQYADENSSLLGQVEQGEELDVLFQEDQWVQVLFQGNVAWVSADLVELVEGEIQAETPAEGPAHDATGASDSTTDLEDEENTDHQTSNHGPAIPLSEATIVIDPGHGGTDPGAVTPTFYEKQVALETSSRLASLLQSTGAEVIMTRTEDTDVSLADRAALSNEYQAHAFISIHYDSTQHPNQKSGTSTYYYDENDSALAETINEALAVHGTLTNNGVHFGDFQVLRDNQQPSILLELGYLNNEHDLSIVYTDDYQTAIAEAIYQGLVNYFE